MGVIVSGKIEAGNVKIGQELMIMPNQVQGRVELVPRFFHMG